jgi:hypothetical protein
LVAADDLEIEFIDDDEEEEEEEEEDGNAITRRYRKESGYGISKDDIIIMMVFLGFGIFIGHWYSKSTSVRKDYPFPFPHTSTTHPSKEELPKKPEEEKDHSSIGKTTSFEKKAKKKGKGYFLDSEGNAILESPALHEQWVVRKDMEGNIIDVYKIPGNDFIK